MKLAFFLSLLTSISFSFQVPAGCQDNQQCILEIPGATCGDGTPAYIAVTARQASENLLIYFEGGGACWNKGTCANGFARPLTRVLPTTDWNTGSGIQSQADPTNPFSRYSVVYVPYCTGDVFSGNSVQNYTQDMTLRHAGFRNGRLSIEQAKLLFDNPKKVVLFGASAGAMGVNFHFRNVEELFPNSQRYVIADSGTPFKPPHLHAEKYQKVMEAWSTKTTLPEPKDGEPMTHFGDLVKYNRVQYPQTRYALIQSYSDYVMTFFAGAVGTDENLEAVTKTMIDAAENDIGMNTPNQKVFFVPGHTHVFSSASLSKTQSLGRRLDHWITAMVNDEPYENIRPDLTREGQLEIIRASRRRPQFYDIQSLWDFHDTQR